MPTYRTRQGSRQLAPQSLPSHGAPARLPAIRGAIHISKISRSREFPAGVTPDMKGATDLFTQEARDE
jgi:hypothetical protein